MKFKITAYEDKSVLKTIRIKSSILSKIEEISKENNLSINRVINECIKFALDNM